MKKLVSILLIVAMMFTVVACTKKEEATKKNERPTTSNKETNSLTLAMQTRLNTLDPYHYTLSDESSLVGYIYDSLFVFDVNSNVVLKVAESITLAEDGAYVEFKLKEGLKFASGDIASSDDVEYSIQRGATGAATAAVAMYTTFEKIDDLTFRLNFVYPELAGFDALASYIGSIFVVSKAYCEKNGHDVNDDMLFDCNGTGPFMLDSINEANGDVTLKKNPNYLGNVALDTIYCKVITGNQELAFEAGEIDMCTYTPGGFKNIAELTNIAYDYNVANYTGFLILNCSEGFPTSDINVRLGLAYALNRSDIALVATDGAGETAYNLCNPTVSDYADVCNHYDRDIEQSKKLLSAAGYSEEKPYELELVTVGEQQSWVDACQIVKENLEESYVKVTITQVADSSRYFQGDYDMAIIGISLTNSVTSYSMLFDSQQLNLACVPAETAEAIIAACMAGTSAETAQAAMKQMVDCMAYYPLYYKSSYLCYDSNLNLGASYETTGSLMINELCWK